MAVEWHLVMAGRLRQRHFADAAAEYEKRLRPWARVVWHEADGVAQYAGLPAGCYTIVLDAGGRQFTSEELAAYIADQQLAGRSRFACLIGGHSGHPPEVLARADLVWSLSRLTFPHQMVPGIVLEQLYRAACINSGRPYHY